MPKICANLLLGFELIMSRAIVLRVKTNRLFHVAKVSNLFKIANACSVFFTNFAIKIIEYPYMFHLLF